MSRRDERPTSPTKSRSFTRKKPKTSSPRKKQQAPATPPELVAARSPTVIQKAHAHQSVWTIWYAAQYGKLARVRSILDRQAVHSIDVQEYRTKWTALHYAARYGQLDIVQLLVERGADPDVADLTGNTPLHLSAGWGNLRCTVLLLEAGAQPSRRNQSQQTPLDMATALARHDQVRVLSSWQPVGLTPQELLERRQSRAALQATDPLAIKVAALEKLGQELQDEPDPMARQELHALCAKTQAHGESHPSLLTTLDRLASVYRDTGRTDKAVQATEQALELAERLYSHRDLITLTWLNNASELLLTMGRMEEGEQYMEQAFQGFQDALGPSHLTTLDVLENLAVVNTRQQRHGQAELYIRELLSRLAESYDDGWNDRVFQLTSQLGVVVLEQKRISEAQEIFSLCLSHAVDLYGDQHQQYAVCIEQLALCAFLLGDFEQAERLFQQALQLTLALHPQGAGVLAAEHRRLHNNLAMVAIAHKSQTAVHINLQEEQYR